ncbi:MAG TPA: hypothetical protein VF723_08650 [Pyrinomonadaceae bacterium]
MKMKLAALLATIVLGLAGCGNNANTGNTGTNANSNANANRTSNTTSSTGAATKADENMVKANANASDETGGTKEGCKCSAAGMACNTKPGEKGCCGAKDGACSSMVDGKSSCCSGKGDKDAACCSAAGKMAMGDKGMEGNACGPTGTEKKTAAPAPAGKKS